MKNFIKPIYEFMTYYFPIIPKILEELYYFYNNLITSNKVYQKNVSKGKTLLKEIISDDKYYYVLIDKGIGDTVIVALYSYFFEKKYNKKICFVVPKGHLDVMKRFNYVKKTIGLTREELDNIVLYISKINKYETKDYCYAFFKMKISQNSRRNWSSSKWNKKLIMVERYKEFVFGIDKNFKQCKIAESSCNKELLKKYDINSKTIIINPYANTVTALRISFWENLVLKLNNNGYNVYTNISNPQKEQVIKGTKSLNVTLDEIYNISSAIKAFIALRSGICEYLALNNINLVVINKNDKNYEGFDNVNTFSTKKTVKNVYVNKKKESVLISEILDLLKEK